MVRKREVIDAAKDELLLACVNSRWEPRALEEARQIVQGKELDWHDFWAQARTHAVAPLIYHTLRDEGTILPARVKGQLQSAYYLSAGRNTMLYQELGDIVHAFDEAGIPVILLKGAALAKEVYGNIALRPMADLDILVRETDISRAEDILLQQGYDVVGRGDPHLRHATFSRRSSQWAAPVELHWHIISSSYYRRSIPAEWLWQDPVELTIGDAPALRLSPQAAMAHACLHMLDHIGIRDILLYWLCDIVEISQREEIDWDALADTAVEFNITLPVRSMLSESRELLSLPIPDHVLQRMLDVRAGLLERKAYAFCLSPTRSSVSKTFLDFFAGEGLSTKFRFLFSRLFPSRDYMMARYDLRNRWLVPLYYPCMIGNAILEGFRALARSGQG